MKFLDLFAGIGGFRLGMERNGHKCVGYVEFDKYARQSYQAIHNTKGEWTAHDITEVTNDDIRELRDRGHIDCITGGFPCQSFSVAGKRGGFDDTRGTLFFEIMRFASILRPQYLFLENVKGLLSHDSGATFETILNTLDEFGYDAEWQVLNSKDFGVPQNRERVFIIGHLRGQSGRAVFPVRRTHDILIEKSKGADFRYDEGFRIRRNGVTPTLTASNQKMGRENEDLSNSVYAVLTPVRENKRQNGRRFKEDGEPMFTLTSQDRHGIAIKEATKKGCTVAEPGVVINPLKGKTENGWHFEQQVYDPKGISRAVKAGGGSGNIPKTIVPNSNQNVRFTEDGFHTYRNDAKKSSIQGTHVTYKEGKTHALTSNHVPMTLNNLRIRKLTPLECWRLQGFTDEQFHKAKNDGVSNSQLYKQAGNSVTVNVIDAIARKL